jgi:hypothetical protein
MLWVHYPAVFPRRNPPPVDHVAAFFFALVQVQQVKRCTSDHTTGRAKRSQPQQAPPLASDLRPGDTLQLAIHRLTCPDLQTDGSHAPPGLVGHRAFALEFRRCTLLADLSV